MVLEGKNDRKERRGGSRGETGGNVRTGRREGLLSRETRGRSGGKYLWRQTWDAVVDRELACVCAHCKQGRPTPY